MQTNDESRASALHALEERATDADAEAFFASLDSVTVPEIFGRWRGTELSTGHPLNGMLAKYGWYGKELVDAETVHPLLFRDTNGEVFRVDPRKVPMGLAPHAPRLPESIARGALSLVRALVETDEPRARLRDTLFRGRVSATMIYDHLPIQDVFRRVDATTLLGVMDRRGDTRPLYFVLRREP